MIRFILLLSLNFIYLLNSQIIVDYPLPIVSGTYSRPQSCTCEQNEDCNIFFSVFYQITQNDEIITMVPSSWNGILEESRNINLIDSITGNNCTGFFNEQTSQFILSLSSNSIVSPRGEGLCLI